MAWQLVKKFVAQEDGTETVEWGIMAGLIIAGLVGIVAAIGTWVQTHMNDLRNDLVANP